MSLLDAHVSKPLEGGPSFSLRHRLFRAAWMATWCLLAAWTPPPLHAWRRALLVAFGAKLHPSARVYGSARIWYPPHLRMEAHACLGPGVLCYCMAPITIGERAIVSQRAHLCAGTHDIHDPEFQLVTRPIDIGARAWVAAEAFIGPGARVAEGAVIGARAVLFGETVPYGVYAGNPARLLRQRVLRDAGARR